MSLIAHKLTSIPMTDLTVMTVSSHVKLGEAGTMPPGTWERFNDSEDPFGFKRGTNSQNPLVTTNVKPDQKEAGHIVNQAKSPCLSIATIC